jgi:hypothetical protein
MAGLLTYSLFTRPSRPNSIGTVAKVLAKSLQSLQQRVLLPILTAFPLHLLSKTQLETNAAQM